MNQFPDHGINDPDVQGGQEHGLPGAEPLVAGTLALMTAYAQGCCEGHRELMAKKIVSNLFMLSLHPVAAPAFKAMAMNLHALWVRTVQQLQQTQAQGDAHQAAQGEISQPDQHRVLWHTTPETLQ